MTNGEQFEYTLYLDILFLDISTIVFLALNLSLITILAKRLKNIEKGSRAFSFSLIMYFVLEVVGFVMQSFYNRETDFTLNFETLPLDSQIYLGGLYLLGLLIICCSPLYLIFILEKTFFKKPMVKEKHIITMLQLSVIVVLIAIIFIYFISAYNPSLDIPRWVDSVAFWMFLLLIVLQMFFFLFGFLFLSRKSSGEYKKYARQVVIGYVMQMMIVTYGLYMLGELRTGRYEYGIASFFVFNGILTYIRLVGVIILFYGLLKLHSIEESADIDVEKQDYLRAFIKPRGLTAEQITVYKEQKICMVCKSKATGFNIFVCPKCDSLYCQNCAKTLSDMENACWSCNKPFDESKPSTPFKKEEEDKNKNKGKK